MRKGKEKEEKDGKYVEFGVREKMPEEREKEEKK